MLIFSLNKFQNCDLSPEFLFLTPILPEYFLEPILPAEGLIGPLSR